MIRTPPTTLVPDARARFGITLASISTAVLLLLALAGCVSRSVGNGGMSVTAAPSDTTAVGEMVVTPEARALGQRILRFGNRGTGDDHAARRRGADLTMARACEGTFVTAAEGPTARGGVVTAARAGTGTQPSEYWYVQFRCVHQTTGADSTRGLGA